MRTARTMCLTFLLFIGIGIPSCTDECSCPPMEGTHFSIQDISLLNYEQKSGGPLSALEANDTVQMHEYVLELQFETTYVSTLFRPRPAPFSLISSAYACSCLYDGVEGAKETVESLTLVSLNDFDDQHLAGDTITSFFEVDHYGPTNDVEEFFQQQLWQEQYFLKLTKKPASGEPLQIKLVLTLDNGLVLEAENRAVFIQ